MVGQPGDVGVGDMKRPHPLYGGVAFGEHITHPRCGVGNLFAARALLMGRRGEDHRGLGGLGHAQPDPHREQLAQRHDVFGGVLHGRDHADPDRAALGQPQPQKLVDFGALFAIGVGGQGGQLVDQQHDMGFGAGGPMTPSRPMEPLRAGQHGGSGVAQHRQNGIAVVSEPVEQGLPGREFHSVLTVLLRIAWRTLAVIVDHGTGRLVWAAESRNTETLGRFFDQLGADRAKLLTHVSCDGAEWIHALVRQRAPRAVICLDPFHVVAWAMKALDKVRVRTMTKAGIRDRHAMWATRKNPPDLTCEQRTSLAEIATTNTTLYRAYLLKEQLREVFRVKGQKGRDLIGNTLDHGLSNARSEATNTHLRALTKRAYGFHSPDALIAMALLTRGGLCPPLPGRAA